MTGTGTGRGGPAGPAGREGETGVLVLFLHLGRSLKKQKLLVAGILALGILQAALLKAPLLLIDEVVGKLFPEARSAHPNALTTALSSSKNAFFDFIGLGSLLPKEGLGQTAALVAFLAVLGALSVYAFRILANLATVRVVVDMRNAICEHLMHLSLRFFAKQRSGDLISTVSNDTSTIQRSFTLFLENAYIEPLMILGNAIIAGSIIPWLFWFVLLMSLLLAIPMMTFGRKVQKGSRKSLHALGRATDTMSQMFQGFRTVKAFQLEARQLEDLNKDNQHFLKRTMRMVQAKTLSQSLLYLLYMLGFAAILIGIQELVGADDLQRLGEAKLMTALAAIGTTYTHVKRSARTYNMIKESQGAMDRIAVHLDQKSDILDRPDAVELQRPRGEVVFDRLSFAYESEPVLDSISLRVEPGQKIAFVGPSGSGKSTLLNLLTRFYDPTAGRILIDGHDLRDLKLSSYLRHVATVDQQPFLFNSSIRENILLGRAGATEADMVAAARAALVDEFVDGLPEGYDTNVHERGSRLSGGQLQRITIARAILRDPTFLLLDEATSALDSEAERGVQEALDNLMVGRTSFIVAHRLSTVRNVDRIFVLDKGRIVESGTHEELMRREGGAYRRLLEMQSHV